MGLLDIIGSITKRVEAAIPFIKKIIKEEPDVSANGILRKLKKAGLGINRSKGLGIIRYYKKVKRTFNYVRYVGMIKKLNPYRLPFSRSPQLDTYSFLIRYEGENPNTGEKETRYMQIHTPKLYTKAEAIQQAIDYGDLESDSEKLLNAKYTVEGVFRNIAEKSKWE